MAKKKRIFTNFSESDLEIVDTPLSILNEVRDELAEKFDNYEDDLDFTIKSFALQWGDHVGFSIVVTSKKIAKYEKELIQITHHPINFYPVRVKGVGHDLTANEEGEYLEAISDVINDDDTKDVLSKIISYSQS